jgi:hypothetical protein
MKVNVHLYIDNKEIKSELEKNKNIIKSLPFIARTNDEVSADDVLLKVCIIFLDFLCPFSHAFFRTSLCVLLTHIESRFGNPHVVILLN